jgi:hypothetical protein
LESLAWKFLHLRYFICLKSSISCRIFEYLTFRGEFLLSPNTVDTVVFLLEKILICRERIRVALFQQGNLLFFLQNIVCILKGNQQRGSINRAILKSHEIYNHQLFFQINWIISVTPGEDFSLYFAIIWIRWNITHNWELLIPGIPGVTLWSPWIF